MSPDNKRATGNTKYHITGQNAHLPGEIYAILSGLMFGLMPLITKTSYQYGSNPLMSSVGFYFYGSLWLLFLISCQSIRSGTRINLLISFGDLLRILILTPLSAGTVLLLNISYKYIDSGLATTLHFTYPIIVMLLSVSLFHIKNSLKDYLCLFLCITGIFLLYTKGEGNVQFIGVIIALFSGLMYAFFCALFDHSKVCLLPALVTTFWLSVFSFCFMVPISLLSRNFVFALSFSRFLTHCVLGLVGGLLGSLFHQLSVQMCGSVKSSMLSTIEPVTSLIVGFVVYEESFSLKKLFGISAILMSCVLLAYTRKS